MYKYKPTWALCPKAFKDASTTQQTLMVFSESLHWLYSYSEHYSIVFLRSEIICDQFTIRFRYEITEEESKVVLDYFTTICSILHSFRKDACTKLLVSKSDQGSNNSFDVEFKVYYDLPF